MATLTDTSLTEVERRALDLFVTRLVDELGDDLVAVWLYGSRARGDAPSGPDSDVDVRVVTGGPVDVIEVRRLAQQADMEAAGGWNRTLDVLVDPLDHWYWMRELEAFIVRELERDAIVLHGPHPSEVGANVEPLRPSPGEMQPRSKVYLDEAETRLRSARHIVDMGDSAVVSLSYVAIVKAVRASLSEQDESPRSHGGLWARFHERYVRPGLFDADLHAAGRRLQEEREKADYGPDPPTVTAREAFGTAERFVAAVRATLEG